MYKLYWKSQSNNSGMEEMYETLEEVVEEFRAAMKGLYVHGGGIVAIFEEEYWENHAEALVKWEEHCSGGFGSGVEWINVRPEENLNFDCENEGCCWHDEDSQELCEDCEREGLDMVLDYLLQ